MTNWWLHVIFLSHCLGYNCKHGYSSFLVITCKLLLYVWSFILCCDLWMDITMQICTLSSRKHWIYRIIDLFVLSCMTMWKIVAQNKNYLPLDGDGTVMGACMANFWCFSIRHDGIFVQCDSNDALFLILLPHC